MPVRCLFLGKRMDDLTEATAMRGMLACGSITWYASPAIDQSFIQRGALVCVCVVRNENPTRLQSANALSEVAASAPVASTSVVWPTGASQQAFPKPLSLLKAAPSRSCERDCMAWHGACRKGTLMCGEPRCRYVTADAVSMYLLEQHTFAYMQS